LGRVFHLAVELRYVSLGLPLQKLVGQAVPHLLAVTLDTPFLFFIPLFKVFVLLSRVEQTGTAVQIRNPSSICILVLYIFFFLHFLTKLYLIFWLRMGISLELYRARIGAMRVGHPRLMLGRALLRQGGMGVLHRGQPQVMWMAGSL